MAVPGTLREGDRISSGITSVGHGPRTGTVKRVIGARDHLRYDVAWDDGKESVVYPAHVHLQGAASAKRKGRRSMGKIGPATTEDKDAGRHVVSAVAGDRLVIRPHYQGEPERDAEIVEALGPGGTPPFRLIWSDTGQETLLFPGTDAYVEHLGEGE